MPRRRCKQRIDQRLRIEFVSRRADGNNAHPRGIASKVDGRCEVCQRSALRLDYKNIRTRCNRMSPLNIERRLGTPAFVVLRQLRSAHLIHNLKAGRSRQAECLIELREVAGDIRIITRRHDRDRLARSIRSGTAETYLVESVVSTRRTWRQSKRNRRPEMFLSRIKMRRRYERTVSSA